MDIRVRSYRDEDRLQVRRICFDTGYMGESVSWYWKDLNSFADIFVSYYTDHEPESLFVVVDDDDLVYGYLTGCVTTTKGSDPLRAGLRVALGGLGIIRPSIATTIWRSISDGLGDVLIRRVPAIRPFEDPRWPSHLHIDLLEPARGKGMGKKLMETWFERLSQLGSSGCFLETLVENKGAIDFFESVGFRKFGEVQPVPGIRTPQGDRLHRQIMVRDIARS